MKIWLSFDVEATGPVPGLHSMLSIGVVAFLDNGIGAPGEIDDFTRNLRVLDDTTWDPDTVKNFWNGHLAELGVAERSPSEPADAMHDLVAWCRSLRLDYPNAEHIWSAWPLAFDLAFLRYYMQRFQKAKWESLYGHERFTGFDMMSHASALRGGTWPMRSKHLPASWLEPPNPRPHVALDDARWQGQVLARMVAFGRGKRAEP